MYLPLCRSFHLDRFCLCPDAICVVPNALSSLLLDNICIPILPAQLIRPQQLGHPAFHSSFLLWFCNPWVLSDLSQRLSFLASSQVWALDSTLSSTAVSRVFIPFSKPIDLIYLLSRSQLFLFPFFISFLKPSQLLERLSSSVGSQRIKTLKIHTLCRQWLPQTFPTFTASRACPSRLNVSRRSRKKLTQATIASTATQCPSHARAAISTSTTVRSTATTLRASSSETRTQLPERPRTTSSLTTPTSSLRFATQAIPTW